ncbi:hypothetical protein E1B28_011065 [Marasmius oreades]|uniref:TEA domain-containing protein n=1 Tax=Marasmius oreades TaxID=181124 RepID=A0A9P7UPT9_9AGAR|nr:uncharacterized protein E1B28_011065 [Marasmius oreades]KAG7089375.1 hypothetical protein E1B28_011065 [Marasmius oreades]
MSYVDYSPSPGPSSPTSTHLGYVCMSTVDDLSYTPSAEEKDRDAAQIVATGRRSWKTLKGKGEAVWPPHLEAALIEALEKYRPDESRSTKALGRFSMRNRFISDYIFETTGKRRTPKQVGSRLQQLRDTCKSERILRLISRRHTENNERDAGAVSSDGHSSSTSPPPAELQCTGEVQKCQKRHNIWVNIVLEQLAWPSPPPVVHIVNNNKLMPLVVHLSPLAASSLSYESTTHCLASMEPTITFASPFALAQQCSYSVFQDDTKLLYTEVAALKCLSDPMQSSGWMYRASLVPEMWKTLCDSGSPTRYTITQYLFPADDNGDGDHCVSIVYNFTHHESSTGFQAQQVSAYDPYLSESLPHFSTHDHTDDTRSWCTTATLNWSSPFNTSVFTPTTTPAYHSTIPAVSRGGRSAVCNQDENWVFAQKHGHATPSLQYC